MPELPEVETVRRSLLACIQNLSVVDCEVNLPKLIQNLSAEDFCSTMLGRAFIDIERRGKYLLFRLSGGYTLVIHLRMTGQLRYNPPETPRPLHTHIVLHLSDGKELRYTDIRQFGFWFLASDAEIGEVSRISALGVEPLSPTFTVQDFIALMSGKKGKVKGVLLDQSLIAGIGNIYADEALYSAGLHPERPVNGLTRDELTSLYESMREVLGKGVQMRGTTFSDYVDGLGQSGSFQHELKVYGRTGEPCRVCDAIIEKSVVAGRGTHICPNCQR